MYKGMESDDRRPNLVLSIKPPYADAILDRDKLWEYRRVAPVCETPFRAVLYATAPAKAPVGACWVNTVLSGRPATVVARTVHETPHEPDDVMDYFDGAAEGHALRVMGARRFDTPIERSTLEAAGVAPSQNFRYLPDINAAYAEQAGVTV